MLSRYSHSALETFRNCPRQFKFARIEKVEVPRKLEAHTLLGNIVHRRLKELYQWAADSRLYPLDDLLKVYDADWEKEAANVVVSSEHKSVDDYIESGRKMLAAYYERFQPFDHGKLLGAEMRLNFTLPGTRFSIIAIVDRLMRRPDGVIEICDYKTGRTLPQGPTDPSYLRQMALYQLAVQTKFPHFDEIELLQYHLLHEEPTPYRMPPEQLDELAEQFRVEIQATINAERRDDFPTQESGLCNFCDFYNLCPAKRHRLAIEAEEKKGEEKSPAQRAAELANRFIENDRRMKDLKNEQTALREDILSAAKELDVTKIAGDEADISVRIKPELKLPTKSGDPDRFAELSFLAGQWGLEECFTLEGKILLRDIYDKGRLSEEQRQKLEEFISTVETSRVSVVKKKKTEE